jgi:hypothetical protein
MRNPQMARDLAERACELSGWADSACLEVWTAAKAALGETTH